MMAGAVLSRVALGSSNTRCLLYLQVCLYATLEMFQIMITQVKTFQLLCPALLNPLPQISSVSIALEGCLWLWWNTSRCQEDCIQRLSWSVLQMQGMNDLMNHICNLKLKRNSIPKNPVQVLTRTRKNKLQRNLLETKIVLLLPYSEALCIPT